MAGGTGISQNKGTSAGSAGVIIHRNQFKISIKILVRNDLSTIFAVVKINL